MQEITEAVTKVLDDRTGDLSQEEYKEVLQDIIGDLETRLEAVEMELEDQ